MSLARLALSDALMVMPLFDPEVSATGRDPNTKVKPADILQAVTAELEDAQLLITVIQRRTHPGVTVFRLAEVGAGAGGGGSSSSRALALLLGLHLSVRDGSAEWYKSARERYLAWLCKLGAHLKLRRLEGGA